MTKSTPLSQIPRPQVQQHVNSNNNEDASSIPSQNSTKHDKVVIGNDEDDINIEEVLQNEQMTNSNIMSLQQQIESLKTEIERKNQTVSNVQTLHEPSNVVHNVESTQSIINKDSLQGVMAHLKNLNYTNIVLAFIITVITYSDYIDKLILSKIGESKYAVSIPYLKAFVIATVMALLYKI